jgi:thiamine biosynthesis lipoprotein
MFKLMLKPVWTFLFVLGVFTGCSVSEPNEVQSLYGYSMGTSYSIKVVGSLGAVRNLQIGIEGVLSDINSRMSTYLPKSDLSRFTEAAVNIPVDVDPKTKDVVQAALKIASESQGAFDPTIAPLVDLWGFGPKPRNNSVPSESEIEAALDLVGYEAVSVDENDSVITKLKPRQIDLSAIAKGYAVDEVASFLLSKGYSDFLVEVGGEMKMSGTKPDGSAWRIAIEEPSIGERKPFRIIPIEGASVATSGDYRNFFESDGVRYSHTIDPKTGYPVEHDLASVTVVMDSCMEADAYATAMLVLGKGPAMALAEKLDLAVFFIYKENDEFITSQSTRFTEVFGLQ